MHTHIHTHTHTHTHTYIYIYNVVKATYCVFLQNSLICITLLAGFGIARLKKDNLYKFMRIFFQLKPKSNKDV